MADDEPILRWPLAAEEGSSPAPLFSLEGQVAHHRGVGEYRGLEFLEVNAKRLINKVPAESRLPFSYTVNAYRGCSHACSYCFARPTHAYLGLGIGADFENRIVVKVNAVERLAAEIASRRWAGAAIAMGTNTDPYQKAEGRYHLTRGIVAALADAGNPFSILTKSTLVLRDLELLRRAVSRTEVSVNFSIATLDREIWRMTEPGTPPPEARLAAVRRLNDAGIPCGVLIAPVLPGLSDDAEHLEAIAVGCREAGAVSVSAIALHLRPGVREHFLGELARLRPDLLAGYERRFARGPYQEQGEQRRIAAIVARVIGGEVPVTLRRASARPAGPTAEQLPAEQLALFSGDGPRSDQ